jgi:hypothetical protein
MPAMHTLYNFLKLVEFLQVIVVRPGKIDFCQRSVSLSPYGSPQEQHLYSTPHDSTNKNLNGTNEIWIDHKKKP